MKISRTWFALAQHFVFTSLWTNQETGQFTACWYLFFGPALEIAYKAKVVSQNIITLTAATGNFSFWMGLGKPVKLVFFSSTLLGWLGLSWLMDIVQCPNQEQREYIQAKDR